MLVINIPKNVYELEECLGYEKNNFEDEDDDNQSVNTMSSGENPKISKIYKKGKYAGDLVIPYQGIEENCFSINFVIYGIKDEIINYNDWLECKKDEKNIEIVFNLSVY